MYAHLALDFVSASFSFCILQSKTRNIGIFFSLQTVQNLLVSIVPLVQGSICGLGAQYAICFVLAPFYSGFPVKKAKYWYFFCL